MRNRQIDPIIGILNFILSDNLKLKKKKKKISLNPMKLKGMEE